MDSSGDGSLSVSELKDVFKTLGLTTRHGTIRNLTSGMRAILSDTDSVRRAVNRTRDMCAANHSIVSIEIQRVASDMAAAAMIAQSLGEKLWEASTDCCPKKSKNGRDASATKKEMKEISWMPGLRNSDNSCQL